MKLSLIVSNQTNPYLNVAVENYLVSLNRPDTVTLYLWKNHRTVVVGQNQNPFAECNVELLESEGGYVMRRSTGGGAVYHDDGNINFSFVVPPSLYDQQRQFGVLMKAVESYGLHCEVSGRNDVLCEGRKFSGNAFSRGRYQNLHHGTILIAGNMDDMRRYLKVKASKLSRHGVASVQSRVVNLSQLAPVTSENIVPRLIDAFEKEYGMKTEIQPFEHICQTPEVQSLFKNFSSEEWIFSRWRTFHAQRQASFPWGEVEIFVSVDEARHTITDVQLSTDSLQASLANDVRNLLLGQSSVVPPAIPAATSNELRTMLSDIIAMLFNTENNFSNSADTK